MISLKDFFSFKNNRAFWLNLIAMPVVVIAVILGVLHWLDVYTHHGESIIVPNVNGLPVKEAQNEFSKKNLRVEIVDSNYVKGILAGAVLEQKPAAGSKVKIGRTIYLTINTGEAPKVTIPDIIDNSSFRQAEARLRALGFKLTEPEYIEGEKDWIYGVKYNGKELTSGEKIPREAVLTLCVGDDKLKGDSIQTDSLRIEAEKPIVDESWF
ncbi:MAG: PASTA domain-containing protein [Bacteroidaceae bacterium]|nr:PASTA domain-containing protein [Bacteroidaceae bacterium]MBR4044517.1 PASTA domain-containing protein [Bacteroidaceae bacterium]